jgi:hypothetical protein
MGNRSQASEETGAIVELGDVVLQIHFYRIISEKIVRSLDASQLMGVPFYSLCASAFGVSSGSLKQRKENKPAR